MLYASAHGFRRAFGRRWFRQECAVLKELMRREGVTKPEKDYVGIQAMEPARSLHDVTPKKKRSQKMLKPQKKQ